MSDSDAALVDRTLAGDLDAYAQLISRYRDPLGRYALYMVGNREDAQEVMQDSFFRAYRSLGECRQPERFGAWLFRIELPSEVASNGDATSSLEWGEEISRALASLRPHYREAFLLRYVEGLEYDEMAKVTGANQPALRMRVKRASDQLRELLRDIHAS
jgi:RNA polymerase sigma-70 factor, ECF subfamily